jgi:hypothetical protein
MSVLKGSGSSMPQAVVIVMLGLFAAIITGVLISPPDAVHGINHDYHAVWQQRVNKQKSAPVHDVPVCIAGALLYLSHGSQLKERVSDLPGAGIRLPVLAIIQTWRLQL